MRNTPCRKKQSPNSEETELYDKVTKVETSIIQRISKLKKSKKMVECTHYDNQDECEEYNPLVNYYDRFWKTYMLNQLCKGRVSHLGGYVERLKKKMEGLQELFSQRAQLLDNRSARKRRKTREAPMMRNYQCSECLKKYEDEEALHIHIKLKHPYTEIKLEASVEQLDDIFMENNSDV